MSETATPAATAETPVVPAATPVPATAATPAPAAAPVETVTLTKEQHDQLARDAARAAGNQRKADLYDRHFGNNGGAHFKAPAQVTPPTQEERQVQADAEDKKAERGILAIAADPEFRDILDADPTLRSLMLTNPLAVLPMLAPDALDAEDALTLVKDSLKAKKPAPTTPAPVVPPTDVPKPGAVTTAEDQTVNEAVEAARKNPNTENAIAGMIGAKVRQGK